MRRLVALMLACAGGSACAERIPEPNVVPTLPHVSWAIASEGPDERERMVCQSDPRSDCVIAASSKERRMLAVVHLYLHPAAAEAKYVGTMQVGFLNGSPGDRHEAKVDATVKPKDPPANVTLTGVVTEKPGVYAMTISLAAMSPSTNRKQSISEKIQVTVK